MEGEEGVRGGRGVEGGEGLGLIGCLDIFGGGGVRRGEGEEWGEGSLCCRRDGGFFVISLGSGCGDV